MTSDLILGTPFLTQIYPFYVNEIGLHTKVMGKTISFRFLTSTKQCEIANLQSSSIYKQINSIRHKQNLRQTCAPLYNRLRKNPKPWSTFHTQIIQQVKHRVQSVPCLGIPHHKAFMIVKADASDIGYGGILKEKLGTQKKQLVRVHSRLWHGP